MKLFTSHHLWNHRTGIDLSQIALVGSKLVAFSIANRIKERLAQLEQIEFQSVNWATKPFRDDIKVTEDSTVLPVDITGKDVILIDDVLIGRTIRAAIDNYQSWTSIACQPGSPSGSWS